MGNNYSSMKVWHVLVNYVIKTGFVVNNH